MKADWAPKNERYERKIAKLKDTIMRKNCQIHDMKQKIIKLRKRIEELENNKGGNYEHESE